MNSSENEFAGFDLDAERKVLRRAGEIVPLPPKTVELLCVLIKNRGEVVSKNELLEAVWEKTFVEESVLSNNIYILRKTLSELGAGKNLIQTVPRRGYRFNAATNNQNDAEIVLEHHVFEQTIIKTENEEQILQPPEIDPIANVKFIALPALLNSPRKTVAFAVVSLVLLTGGFTFWKLNAAQFGKGAVKNDSKISSIAVLPLSALNNSDSEKALGFGIREKLIISLGGLQKFMVRPLPEKPTLETDPLIIGQKLGVDAVLFGSIQRETGTARVNLRLLRADSGEQIWSGSFDAAEADVFKLQDAISRAVNNSLAVSLSETEREQLHRRSTENPAAYENYLKGRYFWNKRTAESLRKAIELFEKAIALDPEFADAYVGLADAQYELFNYSYDDSLENPLRAKDNLLKALSLQPTLPDALVTLGFIQTNFDWSWAPAEKSLTRAIELAPNSADAYHRYGNLLLKIRRFDEAIAALEKARELDPLSIGINLTLGKAYYFAGDYEKAELQFEKTLEIEPNFIPVRWYLARMLWHRGREREALAIYAVAVAGIGEPDLGRFLSEKAQTSELTEIVQSWREQWYRDVELGLVNQHDLAILSIYLQDQAETLNRLEKTVADKHAWAADIYSEPEWEIIRDNSRFQKLLQKMNFEK